MFQMGNEVREGGLTFLCIRKQVNADRRQITTQHAIKLLDLILITTYQVLGLPCYTDLWEVSNLCQVTLLTREEQSFY